MKREDYEPTWQEQRDYERGLLFETRRDAEQYMEELAEWEAERASERWFEEGYGNYDMCGPWWDR